MATNRRLAPSALAMLFLLAIDFGLLAAEPASQPASSPAASQPATQHVDAKTVAELVSRLNHDDFKVRENATQKLIKMGVDIYPLLEAKLTEKKLDSEVVARIHAVLDNMSWWVFDAKEAVRRQEEAAKASGIPKELVLDLRNKANLRLILIPAGKFVMGSPASEKERLDDETQHTVVISKPFYMGVYHVTQEQYEQVMGKNPSLFKGPLNPVEIVSWSKATEFCKILSQKTGKTVTLPTEAQWEYACRAGTTTAFNTGETISTDQANYDGTYVYGDGNKGKQRQKTTPVGSFTPNAWGLYDMHGNVRQWCSDWYGYDYYAKSPTTDPQGPNTGELRVLRGCDWGNSPRNCRSACRHWSEPNANGVVLGFRVVALPG